VPEQGTAIIVTNWRPGGSLLDYETALQVPDQEAHILETSLQRRLRSHMNAAFGGPFEERL
jgi:hypothetical protein